MKLLFYAEFIIIFCVSYTFGEIITQKSLTAPKLSALCCDNREMLHILTCFIGTRRYRQSCPSTRHEGMWKTKYLSSCILIVGTRLRWVFSFTLSPLISEELQALFSTEWETVCARNLLPLLGIEEWFLQSMT